MDPVVLDHGSAYIKAGYANPDADPSVVSFASDSCCLSFLSRAAKHFPRSLSASQLLPSSFCTSLQGLSNGAASAAAGISPPPVPLVKDCLHVLDGGKILDWDVMEDVWQHLLYDQLGWEEGNEGPVLIAEPILTSKVDRETTAHVMFEKFNISGFFAMEAPVLSLYSMGRLTGCCVDVGHTKTDVAAVVDGALIPASACRWQAAGWDMEVLLGRHLAQSNPAHADLLLHPEDQRADTQLLRVMKEKFCSVVENPTELEKKAAGAPKQSFALPDGQEVVVGGEGLLSGESLFRPSVVGLSGCGITDLLVQSLSDAAAAVGTGGQESERVKSLFESVALVGGVSTMPGFSSRFLYDLGASLPPSLRPSIMKPPEYMSENTARYSAWIGGAIIAKIVFAQNQYVTRGDYDEKGPGAVSRKLL